MPFQFNCPQGHLLSAEPNQAGQHVECPICKTQFAIPAPPAVAAPTPPPVTPPPAPPFSPPPPADGLSDDGDGFDPLGGVDDELPAGDDDGIESGGGTFGDIDVYSIPCPNGHVLETPVEMLGQHAMCPHCQSQFELREEDSKEYKERRAREIEKQDAIVGEKWLKRAMWIAGIVIAGLLIMVIIGMTNSE